MTVATTDTREFNLDQLMRRAMQTAGIMGFEQRLDTTSEQGRERASFGRDQLDFVLDRLQAEGILLRDVARYPITLTAGTATYVLPADTIDVHEDGTYATAAGQVESLVQQIDAQEYHNISDKLSSGAPTRFWLERLGICTLYLHQVPDTTGGILTVRRKKMLADSNLGTYTPDLERYWHDYLQWELAYRYSVSMPIEERALLKAEAKEAKETAQNYARQFVPSQIELDHPTGWS